MAPLFHMEALLPSSISPKIDSLLHSHIYPQVGHVFRAVAKFKALLVSVILSKKRTPRAGTGYTTAGHLSRSARSSSKKRSKIASFLKLQFAWTATGSSSSAKVRDRDASHAHSYCDYPTWNVVVPGEEAEQVLVVEDDTADQCWLEEEMRLVVDAPAAAEEGEDGDSDSAVNEIDRLAEKFIARFHAKFLLEKQESYRRYQEMMSRSV